MKTKKNESVFEVAILEKYDIKKEDVKSLSGNLPQLELERDLLFEEYNEILKLDINDPNTAERAKKTRLLIRDNRTKGVEIWRKNSKNYFLRMGQLIDAKSNSITSENERVEAVLLNIEKHAEIEAQKLIDKLNLERIELVSKFKEFIPLGVNLGSLSEAQFEVYKNGAELQYLQKIKTDKAAEKKRIADQKIIDAANEKIRIENAKLKAEKEKTDKILADQKKKDDAEAAKKAAAKKAAEDLAKAPIKERLFAWVESFEIPTLELENELKKEIEQKFSNLKIWAAKEIKKM